MAHQGRFDVWRVGHALRRVGHCRRVALVKAATASRDGPAERLAKRVERARGDLDRRALLGREREEVGKNGRLWLGRR